jgi:protocatechuate 3,4-dioxygenase beta subunit
MACDDEVLYATRQEGKQYASTLIRVAESFDDTVPAGAGFLGLMEVSENLLQRIRAAADGKRCRRFSRRSFAALIVFAALLLPMGVWPPAVSEAETSAGAAPANSEDLGQTVVTGRVTDAEGKPVAGARVTIRGWENGPELRAETQSDAEGRFTVDAKPGNCRLFAYAKGYASMYRTHDVSEGVNPGWDFPLPKSAHVSGRVVDTKGKPAPGRILELWTVDAGPPPGPGLSFHASGGQGEDRTDANGVFDMPSVAPGRHSIMVYSPSPLGGDRNMQQVPVKGSVLEVRSGDRVENFEIVVNPPEDFALSGHVRHADGTPMPGIGVDTFIPHGRHWWTKTDAQGAFRLEGLDGIGQSTFKVNFNDVSGAESFKLAILNVPLNATNVDLVVPGNGNIEGTVRNAKTGEAVTAYKVSVPVLRLPDSGAVWEEPRVEIRQNSGGTFTISNVPAGEVTVEVEAAGLGAQRFTVPVEAGKSVPLACDLLGPAVFEGKTTMNGQPKRVGIIINGDWLNSDDGGNFRFDQYPNGDYVIWFFENDGWHRSADVHLKAGETTRLDMEMGGSCEVRGTVVFPKEEAFCTVRLSPKPAPDGWYEFGRPSPEEYVLAYSYARKPGEQYHLRGIPPGRWYLMAGKYRPSMHRSLLAESREIELKDGESLTIDFNLVQGGEPQPIQATEPAPAEASPQPSPQDAKPEPLEQKPAPVAVPSESVAAIIEALPGKLIFKGAYLHRSRGSDLPDPSPVWLKQTEDGGLIAASDLPAFATTYVAYGASNGRFQRYVSYGRAARGNPPRKSDMALGENLVTVAYEGGEKDGQVEKLTVPEGATFDPNSRPDPYIAANVLLRKFNVGAGESKEFSVYDWDNTGKGLASYTIRIADAGRETITVPAGTFDTRHLIQTQLTFGDTWYKKRPDHVTEFWILDNGVIVRILRHREPYEVLLSACESPEALPGRVEGAATSAPVPAPSGTDAAAEVEEEIQAHYAKADPDVQEYIRWTAKNFTRGGLWQPANAFNGLSPEERETKVQAAVQVLSLGYGRHLCTALATAGALKDPRLLPGLIQAAAYHREDSDYDCRPKWMAVSALGRQDDESAVPTLIPLVDHGNQNTRMWARASLARLTGQNFGDNKQAWGKWWNDAGKQPRIDLAELKPWTPPPGSGSQPPVQIQASSAVPEGGIGPQKGTLRFDGVDDFIHIPPAPQLDLKENFTVSAWVNVYPGCGEAPIYFRGNRQLAHDPCQLLVLGGQMCWKMDGGRGSEDERRIAAVNLDSGWHLWTGVCDRGSRKLLLYKDGQLADEVPAPPPIAYPTASMYNEIGAIDSGAWGGTWGFFKGEIDQISVWNTARTPEEIRDEFTNGVKSAAPGLVALWTFDEDGPNIVDASSFQCNAPLGRTPEADPSDPARATVNQ